VLRERLNNDKKSGRKLSRMSMLALTFHAWDLHKNKRSLSGGRLLMPRDVNRIPRLGGI